VTFPDPEEDDKRIREAVKIAKQCDVVILCIGENEMITREAWSEGHLGDREELHLFGKQSELARALVETGTPVVVVLIHGKPIALNYVAKHVPAILDAWYLGEKTGNIIADALFGKINPGGKLPITYPRSVGQIPVYYSYKPSARRGYLNGDTSPLYPFGYGLSYTTFNYSDLKITPEKNTTEGTARLSVEVTNAGKVIGDEVVQMYIHDKIGSRTRPVKELKGFKRITLKPGETKNVSFKITPELLKMYNQDKKWIVEPGEFEIMVGSSSVDVKTVLYTIIDH
jgi:beta-glucosidase